MDLIDRDYIKSLGATCIAKRDPETNELIALGGIDLLPSAQPERKKKDWIDRGKDVMMRWECPVCGRRDNHIYNFCPDCGEDLRW